MSLLLVHNTFICMYRGEGRETLFETSEHSVEMTESIIYSHVPLIDAPRSLDKEKDKQS